MFVFGLADVNEVVVITGAMGADALKRRNFMVV